MWRLRDADHGSVHREKSTPEPAEIGQDGAQAGGGEIQRGVKSDCEGSAWSCDNGEDGHDIDKYYAGEVNMHAQVMHEVGAEEGSMGDTSGQRGAQQGMGGPVVVGNWVRASGMRIPLWAIVRAGSGTKRSGPTSVVGRKTEELGASRRALRQQG